MNGGAAGAAMIGWKQMLNTKMQRVDEERKERFNAEAQRRGGGELIEGL